MSLENAIQMKREHQEQIQKMSELFDTFESLLKRRNVNLDSDLMDKVRSGCYSFAKENKYFCKDICEALSPLEKQS